LLRNAALGMFDLLGLEAPDRASGERELSVEGIDAEDLLVRWLEELLYTLEAERIALWTQELQVREGFHLSARVLENPAGSLKKEIKAVTYHGLEVEETEAGLEATLVFDV
jgi:SHS2 domain-containing protein